MSTRQDKIAIIGLGLIGGSIAKALSKSGKYHLIGIDKSDEVLACALKDNIISEGYNTSGDFLKGSSLIIISLYPYQTIEFIKENVELLEGAIVTDTCGVKEDIVQEINSVSKGLFEFIGGHPMAGKEVGGYVNSDENLFINASYILTPDKNTDIDKLEYLKNIVSELNIRKVVLSTPKEHDDIIAYTSQLMHIMAVALCQNETLDISEGYSAGSLRDCTRVAVINEKLWSELFLLNKDSLIARISEFEDELEKIKKCINEQNKDNLEEYLKSATDRKLRFLEEKEN